VFGYLNYCEREKLREIVGGDRALRWSDKKEWDKSAMSLARKTAKHIYDRIVGLLTGRVKESDGWLHPGCENVDYSERTDND